MKELPMETKMFGSKTEHKLSLEWKKWYFLKPMFPIDFDQLL